MGYPKYFEDNERINADREYMAAKNILESLNKFEKSGKPIPGLKDYDRKINNWYKVAGSSKS